MLLTTWFQGHLKNYLVSKLNQSNLISPSERTTIIDFVKSSIKKILYNHSRERKSWFLKSCSKISEHKRYATPTKIVPILELWINEEKVGYYVIIKVFYLRYWKFQKQHIQKLGKRKNFNKCKNFFLS